MRVKRPAGTRQPIRLLRALRRRVAEEHGVTALMTAVTLMALFGGATIAVDAGHLWASRRHVIVASDAGALAAAGDFAMRRPGCAAASTYVSDNDGAATMTACRARLTSPTTGFVTVGAQTPVDFAFAGVLGIGDRTVSSSTTAAWGIPDGVRGLRPFGLCVDDPHFQSWLADPRGSSGVARVPYTNEPTDCGGAPGNWGIIDLDGSLPVSNSDTASWVRFGYQGLVRAGDIGGDPGAFSPTLDDELVAVRGRQFPIPLFDRVSTTNDGTGGGSTAIFHVIGFVEVELTGWKTTGPEHSRYLEVSFVEAVAAGTCCAPGPDTGLRVLRICDVDPEFDPKNCS